MLTRRSERLARQLRTAMRGSLPAMLLGAAALAVVLGGANPPLLAQTRTTVSGTIHAPDGSLPSGQIVITANSTFTAADGSVVFKGTVASVPVTNGEFTVTLIPNAGSTPAGTSYSAIYKLVGVPYRNETWVVPQSATAVDLAAVRSATLSGPSELVSASQLPALAGDVTSAAGSASVTVNKVDGVAYPAGPGVDTLPLVTAVNQATYTAVPSCTDTGGNHLNYDTASHSFSCGTSLPGIAFSGLTGSLDPTTQLGAGSGAINLTAGGTDQSVTLQPSGTPESFSVTKDFTGQGLFMYLGGTRFWDNAGSQYTGIQARNSTLLMLDNQVLSMRGGSGNSHEINLQVINDATQTINATDNLEIQGGTGNFVTIRSLNLGYVSVPFASTLAFDASAGNVQEVSLTGNVSGFTITNAAAGETMKFIWVQDSTGGRTVSGAPANMYGFTAPGTTASTRSIQSCTYDGTDWTCGPAAINLTHP